MEKERKTPHGRILKSHGGRRAADAVKHLMSRALELCPKVCAEISRPNDGDARHLFGGLCRECFYKLVQKRLSFIERADWHALISAVRANVVAVKEKSLHTVSGDSGGA